MIGSGFEVNFINFLFVFYIKGENREGMFRFSGNM